MEVTVSNSKKFVILKIDVFVGSYKVGNGVTGSFRFKGDGKEDFNYLERFWSYLIIKELLSFWL